MKKSFSILLATIILGETLSSGVLPVSAAQISNNSEKAISTVFKNRAENLIKNGDFSDGLNNWQVGTFEAGTVMVKQEQGNNYVELAHPTMHSVSAIEQDVTATQLKKYELSFTYQGTPSGQLELQANDSKNNQHQVIGIFNLTDRSATWRQFNEEVVMPANERLSTWDSLTTLFVAGDSGQPNNAPLNIKNVQLTEIS